MAVTYKDYYKILGVDHRADQKAVKQAYRRLARKHHPDQNPGDPKAAERFKDLNEAYEVLSDPEKRRRYDTLGPDWQRHAEAPGSGPFGADGFRVHVERGGDLGEFSEFFRTVFGDLGVSGRSAVDLEDLIGGPGPGAGRRGRPRWASRGQDVIAVVEISLEEAVSGTTRSVDVGQVEPCAACNGLGRRGSGACPECKGSGRGGASRWVEVRIPPGVRDGSRVRAAGEGASGSSGGPAGDLYLLVRVATHPAFERRDDDIHVSLAVWPWDATLGTEVQVPTLRGPVTMRIPPETSSGRTFRLRGYGVPHAKGGGRGDQLVRVTIATPTGLDPRERALWEELRRLRPTPPRP
jgi:DnaJ-class molecular chaperone